MSEYDDPPPLPRVCLTCVPDADPRVVAEYRPCDAHEPDREGTADRLVDSSLYLSGIAESGGEDNRRWCELLHGARR